MSDLVKIPMMLIFSWTYEASELIERAQVKKGELNISWIQATNLKFNM